MITFSDSMPSELLTQQTPKDPANTHLVRNERLIATLPVRLRNGKSVLRPMPVQKGDGVHALPWKWNSTEYVNPTDSRNISILTMVSPSYVAKQTYIRDVSQHLKVDPADLDSVSGITPAMISKIRSTAILKAQANLRKQVASLPMLFLERKATLKTAKKYGSFVLNNAMTMQRKDVKRWLSAIKRRTPKNKMKKLANDIANSHLEFIFGVMPTIDDLTGAFKHFSQPRTDVRTGRGRDRFIVENVSSKTFSDHSSYYRVITTTRDDFSVRCDLRTNITSQVANNFSLLGFNPLYVLYDNHPLSFIVGWFSNFNTWLASLDPLIGLEYVTGSSSIMRKRSVTKRIEFIRLNSGDDPTMSLKQVVTTSNIHRAESIVFEREVHETMPGIQSLRLMDKTSLYTYAASVSLLVQRLVNETKEEVHRKPFTLNKRKRRSRYLPPINYIR